MSKTAHKPTAQEICDSLRKQLLAKKPKLAVCKLPPDQYELVAGVVQDQLDGKLEGISIDTIAGTLVASGVMVTSDQLTGFIRAKKAGRV